MKNLVKRSFAAVTALSLMTVGLMLAGCGGSGGGPSSQVVSGTAVVGDPLAGTVTLKDSSSPTLQKTVNIDQYGAFAVDVTGYKAPFILLADGTAHGQTYKLHSFAEGTGTANINPLSDALVASASEDGDSGTVYGNPDAAKLDKIKNNIQISVTDLLEKIKPLLKKFAADGKNPIKDDCKADGRGLDGMFDSVTITVVNGILTITNKNGGAVIFTGSVKDIKHGVFTNNDNDLPQIATIPVAPSNAAALGGAGQVTVSWNAVSNATAYNVYYATTSAVTTATGTKIANATTPYVQSGLTAGTTYYYIVTAVNSAGEGVASAQASATTTVAQPVPVVPAIPVDVTATGGTNQVTVGWSNVADATSYNVYYATSTDVTKANGTKITGVTNPAVLGNLTAGTTYYYIVTAQNAAGEGAASVQVAATTYDAVPNPAAPAVPTSVTAAGGATQATIKWTPVSGATSYNLYWSTTANVTTTSGTKVAAVTSPYVKTGLSAGTGYYFIVTAANSVGESAASTVATATTNAPAATVPAIPTAVIPVGGTNKVSLTWSAVSGATSYNVYWSTTSGVTTSSTKIVVTTNSYIQTGLAASTAYYYIVTAVNATGQSIASAPVTATTAGPPAVVIPVAPTAVTATGGATQVSISWTAVSGATSYNIYSATAAGVTKTSGVKTVNAANPYVQTGLAAGTTYYYIVTAVNSAGEGPASAQASAATNAAACGTCHFIPPTTGQHVFHVSSQGYGCDTCHGTGYSSTTVNAATHANGVVNIATGTTPGWNATSRSCSNSCHGTKSW